MLFEKIHLKDRFPFLGEDGRDPVVSAYIQDNLTDMKRDHVRRPCLVVCPGGGYAFCSQREMEPIALQFLPEGYQIFVIDYSVYPHLFPCQLREVAALMELIYENQEKWHCDVDKIAIMGFSAGGHLAAHYSNSYDIPEVREVFPDSKPVAASILCYPVITASLPQRTLHNLFGTEELTDEQKAIASCENLVTDRTPPTFLWHCSCDDVVSVKNTLLYASALAEHGITMSVGIYPVGRHGLSTCDRQSCNELSVAVSHISGWMDEAKSFLRILWGIDPDTIPE